MIAQALRHRGRRADTWTSPALLRGYAAELDLPCVFKASYDKANRTSAYRPLEGPGLKAGPGNSGPGEGRSGAAGALGRAPGDNVSRPAEVPATFCRSPAFLVPPDRPGGGCGQDRETREHQERPVHEAPWDMGPRWWKRPAPPATSKIFLTERGTSLGYNNLVVDFHGPRHHAGAGLPHGM